MFVIVHQEFVIVWSHFQIYVANTDHHLSLDKLFELCCIIDTPSNTTDELFAVDVAFIVSIPQTSVENVCHTVITGLHNNIIVLEIAIPISTLFVQGDVVIAQGIFER